MDPFLCQQVIQSYQVSDGIVYHPLPNNELLKITFDAEELASVEYFCANGEVFDYDPECQEFFRSETF